MVTIKLFGSISISCGPSTVRLGGRCAGLLAYVALHRGRPIPRAELLEHVWADRGDRLNPSTFSTALWRLRQRLRGLAEPAGEVLACDADGNVQLNPAIALSLDVADFERLVTPALRVAAVDLEAHAPQLEAAAALYRADLLLDQHDDWVLRERERLRRLHLNGLGRLLEHATAQGAHRDAMLHAQAILDYEPLREDVHCALMRAQLAAGQRAMALRQFEHCRALLRSELAIAPMADTLALYRQIAESGLQRAERAPAAVADVRAVYANAAADAGWAPGVARVSRRRELRRRAGERRRAPAAGVANALSRALAETSLGDALAPAAAEFAQAADACGARLQFESAKRCLDDATARLAAGLALLDR